MSSRHDTETAIQDIRHDVTCYRIISIKGLFKGKRSVLNAMNVTSVHLVTGVPTASQKNVSQGVDNECTCCQDIVGVNAQNSHVS